MVFDITPALFGALFAVTVNIYVYRRAPTPVISESPAKPEVTKAEPHKPSVKVKASESEDQMMQAPLHVDLSQHRSQTFAPGHRAVLNRHARRELFLDEYDHVPNGEPRYSRFHGESHYSHRNSR